MAEQPAPLVGLPEDARRARALGHLAGGLVVLTLGLMVLGALVRAHGAGLACPDWPLCFGRLVPRFDLKVAFEYTHRVVAGSVALLFAALAVAILRRPALARHLRGRLAVAAGLLGLQILLGALTVWHLLAVWTVTAHLVTANLFAITLAVTSARLGELARPPRPPRSVPRAARDWIRAAAVLLAVQVVLGGLVSSSYAGVACPDWPTCQAGSWLPPAWNRPVALHFAHRWNALALLVCLAGAARTARRVPGLAGLALGALALGLAQTGAGIANVLLRIPVEVTGLHSALAAALVLTTALAVRAAGRNRTP